MSRIEHLSSFFTERLMSVAAEIYEAVKETVCEYQKEIERTKEENHRLRELLVKISVSGELREPATDLQPSHPERSPDKQDSYQRPLESDPSVSLPNKELPTLKKETEQLMSNDVSASGRRDPELYPNKQDSYQRPLDLNPSVLQQKPVQKTFTTLKEETQPQPNNVSTSTSLCAKSVHGEEFTCLSVTPVMVEEKDQQMDHIKVEQYDSQLPCPSPLNLIDEPTAGPSRDFMGSVAVTQSSRMVFDSSTLASQLQYHEDSTHHCKVCGQPFTKCACLFLHRKIVHEKGKMYCCKLCGKCYRQAHSLTIHFRNHTGEKPFRCRFCGKTFSNRCHCNAHERIHTGDKRYICTVCGKGFIQSSHLRTHLRNNH